MKTFLKKFLGISNIDEFNSQLYEIMMILALKVFKGNEKKFVDFIEDKTDTIEFAAKVNSEILTRSINSTKNSQNIRQLVELKKISTDIENKLDAKKNKSN